LAIIPNAKILKIKFGKNILGFRRKAWQNESFLKANKKIVENLFLEFKRSPF
jgi:hypothetical protein